jgi:acetylornithine deacetylase/succinyl-diaminopimelate desuccinylase-like protein
VYGRGAVDTKASLAVALALLQTMHKHGQTPTPNLLIAATVDEENAARSAPEFARWVQAKQIPLNELLVAEPTNCRPVFGHKGGLRLRFTVHGQASHSSQPERGKNAITAAARLIAALDAENDRLQTIDTELGRPALTVSLIDGGVGANVVPDRCRVTIDRRTVVGEEIDAVAARLQTLAEQSCPLPLTVEKLGSLSAFWQPPDSPWVRQLAGWSGHAPETAPYGTNAWAYGDLPGECVVLGPGSIDQAHGPEEWVEISELEKLAGIYRRWWGLE